VWVDEAAAVESGDLVLLVGDDSRYVRVLLAVTGTDFLVVNPSVEVEEIFSRADFRCLAVTDITGLAQPAAA
jgi:hypothetical protein